MDIFYIIIFGVTPILLLNYFSIKPQRRLSELYRKKINPNELFSPLEYIKKYKNKPLEQIKDAPKMFLVRFEVFWRDYHDKELNKAAREVRLYFVAQTLVIIIDFFLFGYLLGF